MHGTYYYTLRKDVKYKLILGGAGGGGSTYGLHYRPSAGKSGAWQEYYIVPRKDALLKIVIGKGGKPGEEGLTTPRSGEDGEKTYAYVIADEKIEHEFSVDGGVGGISQFVDDPIEEVVHYNAYQSAHGATLIAGEDGGDGVATI